MYPDPHLALAHDHATVLIVCFALAILHTLTYHHNNKTGLLYIFFAISVAIWVVWRAAQM